MFLYYPRAAGTAVANAATLAILSAGKACRKALAAR